jgi:hypothetical protein
LETPATIRNRLKRFASFNRRVLSKEKLAIRCAQLSIANAELHAAYEITKNAFRELREKYDIREGVFAAAIAEKDRRVAEALEELVDLTRRNRAQFEAHGKQTEAEYKTAYSPKAIEEIVKKSAEPLLKEVANNAHIEGQKVATKARAKLGGHAKDLIHFAPLRADAYKWFDENAAKYPKDMNGCAEAATKAVPLEFRTTRRLLKEWKAKKKAENIHSASRRGSKK